MTKKDKQQPDPPESDRPEPDGPLNTASESDATTEAESAAAASDTFEQASDELPETESDASEDSEENEEPAPEPAPELKRLQKILAQSGIASRRHAEELITQGRVQVNGQVVTELGSKADAHRDHIRVDGKLIHGSERLRYFMLNKPKGYVTTVSDPEGRPTIMEFFSKTRERLYPVGRLDYLSEGLLLVTNDGELANKLTRAASNVEKTYLVKVSGQPSEENLDLLRKGVSIQKGKAGSDRVQTAPAEIRPFRPGKPSGKRGPSRPVDNPWYEVVLIEGRNRELRKMFEEIGHHVEKIRRVGYGPLILDLEPGKIRELDQEEVDNLRKAAEGKYRKPKPREPRKREFAQRSERRDSKPRWNERRPPEPQNAGDAASRPKAPFRRDQPGFDQRPGTDRRPGRDHFRRGPGQEPRREFRPGTRPDARSAENRPPRSPRRDDRGRPPYKAAPGRPDRGAQTQPPSRGPQRTWSKPDRGSRSQEFERKPGAPSGERATPFQRSDRRSPGGFRPRPAEGRPPRFEKRPYVAPAAPGAFTPKPKLDIQPLDEVPSRPDTRAQDRNRPDRPFQARSGQRTDRPSFQARTGQRPERSRSQTSPSGRSPERRQAPSGPPRFDRDRKEKPRSDRDREQPRFDRPHSTEPSGRPNEIRPGGPNRGSGKRSSGSRPGAFKPGKRSAPGGKPSSSSASGRRPGSRPAGKKTGKRRP